MESLWVGWKLTGYILAALEPGQDGSTVSQSATAAFLATHGTLWFGSIRPKEELR